MNHEKTIKRIQELANNMALEWGCRILNKELNEILTVTHLSSNDECINCLCEGESNTTWIWKKYLDNNFEILGKPITLEVILQAMFKHDGRPTFVIEGDIANNTARKRSDMIFTSGHLTWNLSKDNFNDQSEETKTFIGELLK